MCRVLAYLGRPTLIDDLLYQPDSSLVRQAYAPQMLVGSNQGVFAFGIRHGMLASFFSDIITLEISHQMLVTSSRTEHDIRGVASVNILILLYALASAS